jgi:hypothetical protein
MIAAAVEYGHLSGKTDRCAGDQRCSVADAGAIDCVPGSEVVATIEDYVRVGDKAVSAASHVAGDR